jgi:hypothetical protein
MPRPRIEQPRPSINLRLLSSHAFGTLDEVAQQLGDLSINRVSRGEDKSALATKADEASAICKPASRNSSPTCSPSATCRRPHSEAKHRVACPTPCCAGRFRRNHHAEPVGECWPCPRSAMPGEGVVPSVLPSVSPRALQGRSVPPSLARSGTPVPPGRPAAAPPAPGPRHLPRSGSDGSPTPARPSVPLDPDQFHSSCQLSTCCEHPLAFGSGCQ